MFRSRVCSGAAPLGNVGGQYGACGLPLAIAPSDAAVSEGMQARDVSSYEEAQALKQDRRYQAAYEQIARRFGELGVPEECILPAVIDPLAAVVAVEKLSLWRLFDWVVDTAALNHPSTKVMAAVATMTDDGKRPVIPTAPFIDGVARAFANELGASGSWFEFPFGLAFSCA